MTITGVKIRKLHKEGRMRALVSITLDNEFAVHDIKVIEGPERLFAAMPSRRDEDGVFHDIVHPIGSEARRKVEDAVLAAYNEALQNASLNEVKNEKS